MKELKKNYFNNTFMYITYIYCIYYNIFPVVFILLFLLYYPFKVNF